MVQIDKEGLYDRIIYTLIANIDDGCTGIHDEYEIDDTHTLSVNIDVDLDSDGYYEDDYFNGTGFYVVTRASACVNELELLLYNTETDEYEPMPFSYRDLEDKIEDALVDAVKC